MNSPIAKYVTDVDDCGTYVLHLNEAKTRALWDEVDALQSELDEARLLLGLYANVPAPTVPRNKMEVHNEHST